MSDTYANRYATSRERFAHDIRDHEVKVLRDDGHYRHLRCRRPDTITMYFDIVTWPGYLAYVGDMGNYLFSRTRDMFEFFESESGRINPQYWAEKTQGGGINPAESFSEDAYAAAVGEWRDQVIADDLLTRYATDCEHYDSWLGLGCSPPYTTARGKLNLTWSIGSDPYEVVSLADLAKIEDFKYEVEWQLLRSGVYSEESAYNLLYGFKWYDGHHDTVRIEAVWDEFGSFREYDFRFLWCCHALVWAIGEYRKIEALSDERKLDDEAAV